MMPTRRWPSRTGRAPTWCQLIRSAATSRLSSAWAVNSSWCCRSETFIGASFVVARHRSQASGPSLGPGGPPGTSPSALEEPAAHRFDRCGGCEREDPMHSLVKDLMTTQVVAVGPSARFKEIVARLAEHRVSAVPVVDDDGRVLGLVSEADLLLKEEVPHPDPDTPLFWAR